MKLARKFVYPPVDIVVERQWHIGIQAKALNQAGMLGTVYGGFPAFRYLRAGVPKESLRVQVWAIYWHELCRRLSLPRSWDVDVPRTIAGWVSGQPKLNKYVACYSTVYRYLFPALRNRGHVLILERGSTNPENYFQQIQLGKKEAGLAYEEKLPPDYIEEIKAGHLAHFIVAGSTAIKESYVSRGFDAERILLIPYGTDEALFTYAERPEKLDRPLRIACVGSIGIRKGLQRLLWIGEWAKRKKLSVELWIIGPLEPECDVLLEKTSAIFRCLGVKKGVDLVSALHSCDLYCLPSYEEGFGISVIEAMSTGLPVLVSREAGSSEAVTDGVDGIILDSYEDEDLDKKLSSIFRDGKLREEMGLRARKKVEAKYTVDHYCKILCSEYQRMFSIVEKAGNDLKPACPA